MKRRGSFALRPQRSATIRDGPSGFASSGPKATDQARLGGTADLSVVIPSFDTARMTLRCCRAVLESTPAPAEVIVADDGSTDGTAALLAREAPAVRVVRLESNRGFAAAANRGVAAAH